METTTKTTPASGALFTAGTVDFGLDPKHWAVQCGMLDTFKQQPSAVAVCHVPVPSTIAPHPFSQEIIRQSISTPASSTTPVTTATVPVSIQLNPTDVRNYRLIFRILYEKPEDIPFNKIAPPLDGAILGTATSCIGAVLQKQLGLYLQLLQLGNNSQSWDNDNNCMRLGNTEEPYVLHFHGLLRGDPKKRYFGDSSPPLGGPEVGTAVVVQGLDQKVSWAADNNGEEIRTAAKGVAAALAKAAPEDLLGCRFELL